MDIDWSKAPEGATHWDTGCNGRVAGWMRLHGNEWSWWPVEGANCEQRWFRTINRSQPVEEFVERKGSEWTGEGLPAVGTVCELRFNTDQVPAWSKVEVLYLSDRSRLFNFIDDCEDLLFGYQDFSDMAFRPIRTPEQIAAEERDGAIHEMVDSLKRWNTVHELCGMLHDAGYRKFEIVEGE